MIQSALAGPSYAFVDGNYLLCEYEQAMQTVFGKPGYLDFERMRDALAVEKLFFYDALETTESIGKRQDQQASEAKRADRESLHMRIREVDGCHVRLGTAHHRGSKRGLEQKEVDILLAVDALLHASQRNIRHAVIVAGDSDFKPLVSALLQLGVYVSVAAALRSDGLSGVADRKLKMTLGRLGSWSDENWDHQCRSSFGLVHGFASEALLVGCGTFAGGRKMNVHQHVKDFYLFAGEETPEGADVIYVARSLDKILSYGKFMFGDLDWEPAAP